MWASFSYHAITIGTSQKSLPLNLHTLSKLLNVCRRSRESTTSCVLIKSLVTTPAFVASPSQPTQQSISDVVKNAQATKMEELLSSNASNYGPRIRDVSSDLCSSDVYCRL